MRKRDSRSWRRGTPIDILVTDIGLPGGLNGQQLAHSARRLRPDLKVLLITGYATTTADDRMEVMTKPFSINSLGARIQAMNGS